MFRLIRSLHIERKCYFQNVKMSSPMSQTHMHDFFNKLEKKESDTEDGNIKNNVQIESQETSKIIKTNAGDKNSDADFFCESIDRIRTDRNLNLGGVYNQDFIINSDKEVLLSSPDTLIQFLKHLASTKQRPFNLIKSAVDRLTLISSEFTLMQCSVLLFSLSKLSYRDKGLLDKICDNIKAKKSQFNDGVLPVSMLQSLGMLKYRNCELVDILLQFVLKHKDVRTPEEKITVLMTLAVVNYLSPLGTVLLQELVELCEKDFNSTKSYLDFVWASVILNHPSEKHISSVLSDDFVNRLLLSAGSLGYDICSLKLLNINAAAQIFLKGDTKPFLNKRVSKTLHQSRSKMEFTRLVVDGLCHLFSNSKDIRVNIDTGAGFILDLEFSNKNNGNNKSRKFFEKDDEKVGIILLGFNDICFDEAKTVTGINTFKQRILEAKNYKTVNIPHSEYNESMNMFEKSEYLQKKLKSVVGV